MKFYNLGHKTFETDFSICQTDNRLGKDIYHNVLKRMSHPKDTFMYTSARHASISASDHSAMWPRRNSLQNPNNTLSADSSLLCSV